MLCPYTPVPVIASSTLREEVVLPSFHRSVVPSPYSRPLPCSVLLTMDITPSQYRHRLETIIIVC